MPYKSFIYRWGWILLFLLPIAVVAFVTLWSSRLDTSKKRESAHYLPIPSSQIQFFLEPDTPLEIENVVTHSDSLFNSLPGTGVPNFGFSQQAVWLKFVIQGNVFPGDSKILEVKNPILNHVDLYERYHNEVRLVNATGDATPFDSRMIAHRNFQFALEFEQNSYREYYLRLDSGGEQLMVPLAVMDAEGMARVDSQDNLIRGSYFGIILFILFFNLFIYLIIREKSSLYYIHYNLNLLLLQLSLSGYAFPFFWPHSPWLANISTPLFASLSVFALLRFSQHFLNLQQFYPRINKIFQYAGFVLIGNAILSCIWIPGCFYISVISINVLALLLNFTIIPVGIAVYRKKFKPAKYFLAGFILLVITVFGFIATNLGLIQNAFFADYGLLIGSAAEVILLSLAIVDRFRSFKDQALEGLKKINRIEKEQNRVLEIKVKERTEEINQQKTEIEFQKEEIISSIRYAEKIQKNVLPVEQEIKQEFPESFVYYRPKDIVSGDFYWITRCKQNGKTGPPHDVTFFATGDCTGHGVPGALMSVMSVNMLRETVSQYPDEMPDQLLWNLETRLTSMIRDKAHEHAGDGMDIGLFSFRHDTRELNFAGANSNLSVLRNGNWLKLAGTRRPIGVLHESMRTPFENQAIQLIAGDRIYSWTDGLPDQFGGISGKKLKTSALREFIGLIANLPMAIQKKKLETFINDWKGTQQQVDDICLVGIQVN